MPKYFAVIGFIWLLALAFFTWGAAMVQYQIFPYDTLRPTINEVVAFWKGDPMDERSLAQRLWTGVTIEPLAFAVTPAAFPINIPLEPVDTSSYRGPALSLIEDARYFSDGSLNDFFLIYGSFGFEDTNWGIILISHDGQVLRAWPINPDQQEYGYLGPHIGLALSKSGDLVTNKSGVLTSYSWCGDKNWEAEWEKPREPHDFNSVLSSDYHHDITYHEGRYYTFVGPEIVAVDDTTGKITERIHVVEIIRWARDQGLSIFDARFVKFFLPDEFNEENLVNLTFADPFHFNKIDILSDELAASFDMFRTGDMLISMRELNLVFVLRPETQEILWYRYGLVSRQHDATFQRGYISVFDNNPFANSGSSPQIVALHMDDQSRSILFDLKQWGAEMRSKGNHELDDDSHVLAFSDDGNGRAVVGRLSGEPLFVFENSVASGQNLELRNITRVPSDRVEEWRSKCD